MSAVSINKSDNIIELNIEFTSADRVQTHEECACERRCGY